jgi:outer membrane protein insertion porin family
MSLIKKSILIFFSLTVVFLIKVDTSFASQKVSEIRIEGNLRVDRETILAFISLTEGSEYNPEDINLTLKELYKTGFF